VGEIDIAIFTVEARHDGRIWRAMSVGGVSGSYLSWDGMSALVLEIIKDRSFRVEHLRLHLSRQGLLRAESEKISEFLRIR
jgi:hypothetical protein